MTMEQTVVRGLAPLDDMLAKLTAVRGAINSLLSLLQADPIAPSTPATAAMLRTANAAEARVIFNYLRYEDNTRTYEAMRVLVTAATASNTDPTIASGIITFYERALLCRNALPDAFVARLGRDLCFYFSRLESWLFGNATEIRRPAVGLFQAMQEAAQWADVADDPSWPVVREAIKTRHVDTIQHMVRSDDPDSDWSGLWCILVGMMGREILTNRECLVVFNSLLNILGDVFRHQQVHPTQTVADGFRCWQVLIDLFFKHRSDLRDKHYKLLMNLMKSRPKADKPVLVDVKAKTWWRFLHHLDPKNDRFHSTTADFLEFCCSTVVKEDPHFCCEAVALLVDEHLAPTSTHRYEIARPEFGPCLPGREHFIKLHQHLFAFYERLFAMTPFTYLEPDSVLYALVSASWVRVLARVAEVIRVQTANSHSADVIRALLVAIGRIAMSDDAATDEQTRRQGLLVTIPPLLGGEFALPEDVLTSTKHYAGEGLMVGTPALYLTRLLLSKHLLKTCLREGDYLDAVRSLMRVAVSSPLTGIEYVEKVTALLGDRAAECGEQGYLDTVFDVWRALATTLGDALATLALVDDARDLGWLYAVMEFPVAHYDGARGGDQAIEALRVLMERVHTATQSLPLGPNEVCEQLCARLAGILDRAPRRIVGVAGAMKHVVCASTTVADRSGGEQCLSRTLSLLSSVSDRLRSCDRSAGAVAICLCNTVWAVARGWPDTDAIFLRMVPVVRTLYEYRGNREAIFDKLFLTLYRQLWKTYLVKRYNPASCSPEVREAVGDLVIMVKELMAAKGDDRPDVEVVDDFENSPTPVAMYYLMPVASRRPILAPRNNPQSVGHNGGRAPPPKIAPAAPDDDDIVCLSLPTAQTEMSTGVDQDVVYLPTGRPIAGRPQQGRLLTKHQREVMRRRRDDIPALYGDLTQDTQVDTQPGESSSTQETIPERFTGAKDKMGVDHTQDSNAAQEPFVPCAAQQVDPSRPFGIFVGGSSASPEHAAKSSIFNALKREKMSPIQLKWFHPQVVAKKKDSPQPLKCYKPKQVGKGCVSTSKTAVVSVATPSNTPEIVTNVTSGKVTLLANGTTPGNTPKLSTNLTPDKTVILANGVIPVHTNAVTPIKTTAVSNDASPRNTTLLVKVPTPTSTTKLLTIGTPSKSSVLKNVLTPSNSPKLVSDVTPSKTSVVGQVPTPGKTLGLANVSTPSTSTVGLLANVLTPNNSPILASTISPATTTPPSVETCPVTSTALVPEQNSCAAKYTPSILKKAGSEQRECVGRKKSILAPLLTAKDKTKKGSNIKESEINPAERRDCIFSGNSVFLITSKNKPDAPPPFMVEAKLLAPLPSEEVTRPIVPRPPEQEAKPLPSKDKPRPMVPPPSKHEAKPLEARLLVPPPSKEVTRPLAPPPTKEKARPSEQTSIVNPGAAKGKVVVTDSQDFVDSSQESIRSVKITLEKLPDIPPGGNAIIAREGLVSRGPEAGSPIRLHRQSPVSHSSPSSHSAAKKALLLDGVRRPYKRPPDPLPMTPTTPTPSEATPNKVKREEGASIDVTPDCSPNVASIEPPRLSVKKRKADACDDNVTPVKLAKLSTSPSTKFGTEVSPSETGAVMPARRVALLTPTCDDNNVLQADDDAPRDAPPPFDVADKRTYPRVMILPIFPNMSKQRELKNLKIDFAPSALQMPRKRRRKTDPAVAVKAVAEISDSESVDSFDLQKRVSTRRSKGRLELDQTPSVGVSDIQGHQPNKVENLMAPTTRLAGDKSDPARRRSAKGEGQTLVELRSVGDKKQKVVTDSLRRRSSKLPSGKDKTATKTQKISTVWDKFRMANPHSNSPKADTVQPEEVPQTNSVPDVEKQTETCAKVPADVGEEDGSKATLETCAVLPEPSPLADGVPPETPVESHTEPSPESEPSLLAKEPPTKVDDNPASMLLEELPDTCPEVIAEGDQVSKAAEAKTPEKSCDLPAISHVEVLESMDVTPEKVEMVASVLPAGLEGPVSCEEAGPLESTQGHEDSPVVPDSQTPSEPGTQTSRLVPHRHPRTPLGRNRQKRHARKQSSRSQEIVRIGNEWIEAERGGANPNPPTPTAYAPSTTIDYENCVETTTNSNGAIVSRPWVKGVWSPSLRPHHPILKGALPVVVGDVRRQSLRRVNFPDEFVVTKELLFIKAKKSSRGIPLEVVSQVKASSILEDGTPKVAIAHKAVSITIAVEPNSEEKEEVVVADTPTAESQETQEFVSPTPLALPTPELLDDTAFFFPPLIDCDKPVNDVAQFMVTPTWRNNLNLNLRSDLIETVGDFCRLSERQVSRLPLREPKLETARKTLRKYLKCLFEAERITRGRSHMPPTDVEIALADRTPREVADALQNLPNCNDHLNYIFERMSRSQKLQGIDYTYLIRHILRLCDATEIFDALASEHKKKGSGSFVDAVIQYVSQTNDDIREMVVCGIREIRPDDFVKILVESDLFKSSYVNSHVTSYVLSRRDCGEVLEELKKSGRMGDEATRFVVENVHPSEILAMMGESGKLQDVDVAQLCGRLHTPAVLDYALGAHSAQEICDRLPLDDVLGCVKNRGTGSDLVRLMTRPSDVDVFAAFAVEKERPESLMDRLKASGKLDACAKFVVENEKPEELLRLMKDTGRLDACTKFVAENASPDVLLGHMKDCDNLATCTRFVCDNERAAIVMEQLKHSGKLEESTNFVLGNVKSEDVLCSIAGNEDNIDKVLTSYCSKFGFEKYYKLSQEHLKKAIFEFRAQVPPNGK